MSNNHKKRKSKQKHNHQNNRKNTKQATEEKMNLPTCRYCQKTIRNISTAIAEKETGTPVHFDCVIKKLSAEEPLGNHEKICYLGNGSFGVIRQKQGSGSKHFFVRKRIPYENRDNSNIEWRKKISNRLFE
jgi:hypothetical protein